jgi:hypothetical protein
MQTAIDAIGMTILLLVGVIVVLALTWVIACQIKAINKLCRWDDGPQDGRVDPISEWSRR